MDHLKEERVLFIKDKKARVVQQHNVVTQSQGMSAATCK